MESQPLEVVHTILRYVIGVPLLFNPEEIPTGPDKPGSMIAFYSNGSILADEEAYWKAEIYRNACRRVCKAWDAYLQQFDHRLVRLHDVFGTEVVPVESLPKALFISPRRETQTIYIQLNSYKDAFLLALTQLRRPARIRVIFSPGETFYQEEVSIIARWAPQLRAIVSARGFAGPLRNFPAMVYGSIKISAPIALHSLPVTLRSLSVSMDADSAATPTLYKSNLEVGSLPALDFLCIRIRDRGDCKDALLFLLSIFGSSLTSLEILTVPELTGNIDDILDLCPQVQVLYMNLHFNYELSRPNDRHRPHTLIFSPTTIVGLMGPTIHEGLLVLPGWPQIRRIVADNRWSDLRRSWSVREFFIWASLWEGSPVRIEDRDGISIQEWLGSQTEHR